MSDVEEISRAVAELAKFGTTSVEATGKILDFLSKIFGTLMGEAAGIVGDKLQRISKNLGI